MAPPKRVRGRPQRTAELPIDPRQQGLRAFQAGRFDTAMQYWIALAPVDPQMRSALAEAYFRRALASPTSASALSTTWPTWLNGAHLGRHEGGHLPFALDLGPHLRPEGNLLVVRVDGRLALTEFPVPRAALWAPGSPNRYELVVELRRDGAAFDRYTLPVGIRTVRVEGDRLLLNGEPVTLRGFGRHEDFPVLGRGISPAVMVKDYELMRLTGANSFRTAHYPYAEEQLNLADRLGFLVIGETAAVGLFFAEEDLERRQELCRQYTRQLIARDKNRPSVIMWSLANEPHAWRPEALPHLRELCDLARELDPPGPRRWWRWPSCPRRPWPSAT